MDIERLAPVLSSLAAAPSRASPRLSKERTDRLIYPPSRLMAAATYGL